MSVSDVKTELLNAQMKISDAQVHIRDISSELLHAQTTLCGTTQKQITGRMIQQELEKASKILGTTQEQIIGMDEVTEKGIRQKLHKTCDALSRAHRWWRLSPNAQAILDARINMEETKKQLARSPTWLVCASI